MELQREIAGKHLPKFSGWVHLRINLRDKEVGALQLKVLIKFRNLLGRCNSGEASEGTSFRCPDNAAQVRHCISDAHSHTLMDDGLLCTLLVRTGPPKAL